jgi:hypothetical protein
MLWSLIGILGITAILLILIGITAKVVLDS